MSTTKKKENNLGKKEHKKEPVPPPPPAKPKPVPSPKEAKKEAKHDQKQEVKKESKKEASPARKSPAPPTKEPQLKEFKKDHLPVPPAQPSRKESKKSANSSKRGSLKPEADEKPSEDSEPRDEPERKEPPQTKVDPAELERQEREKQVRMFERYLEESGLSAAFRAIFSEVLSKKVPTEQVFAYAATRLRQLEAELPKLNPDQPETGTKPNT